MAPYARPLTNETARVPLATDILGKLPGSIQTPNPTLSTLSYFEPQLFLAQALRGLVF